MATRAQVLGWGTSLVLHAAVAVPLFLVAEPPPLAAEVEMPVELAVMAPEETPDSPAEAAQPAEASPPAETVKAVEPPPPTEAEPPPPVQAAEPPPVQTAEPPPMTEPVKPEPVQVAEAPPPDPEPALEPLPEPPPPAPPPPPRPAPPRPTPPRPAPPRPAPPRPSVTEAPSAREYAPPAATAAPAAPSRPRMAAAGPPPNWTGRLSAAINRAKRYPREAEMRGIQGVVIVTFAMRRDGTLISARVSRSSGSELLDEAAVETLQRASLPPVPEEFSDDTFSAAVPINFNVARR
ncbi:MAG: energy transducer TonB [Azospirillum brasilense]|nr:MAG: energy transducer TonB [Azospirillum brasilense]